MHPPAPCMTPRFPIWQSNKQLTWSMTAYVACRPLRPTSTPSSPCLISAATAWATGATCFLRALFVDIESRPQRHQLVHPNHPASAGKFRHYENQKCSFNKVSKLTPPPEFLSRTSGMLPPPQRSWRVQAFVVCNQARSVAAHGGKGRVFGR